MTTLTPDQARLAKIEREVKTIYECGEDYASFSLDDMRWLIAGKRLAINASAAPDAVEAAAHALYECEMVRSRNLECVLSKATDKPIKDEMEPFEAHADTTWRNDAVAALTAANISTAREREPKEDYNSEKIMAAGERLLKARASSKLVAPIESADFERGRYWKHKKRGSTYTEIARGKVHYQVCTNEDVVVYRDDKDGSVWIRQAAEFEDGRFELLSDNKSISERERGWIEGLEEAARLVEEPYDDGFTWPNGEEIGAEIRALAGEHQPQTERGK